MSKTLDFEHLVGLCRRAHQETQRSTARAVDRYLVTRNWLFGWYIVEYEQSGADRAEYGAALIKRLADKLTIRGCSSRSLALSCKFYRCYSEILQTPSAQSTTLPPDERLDAGRPTFGSPVARDGLPAIVQTPPAQLASHTSVGDASAIRPTASDRSAPPLPVASPSLEDVIALLAARFSLGWSHYVTLLTIDNAEARRFYEIEAMDNGWSVRELERQIASSLYERLALSRDKAAVRRLSREGHVVEKAADLIKNPLVLEFLGLEEKPAYSESELETAIIDRLQQFLLELGKGFLFEARQKRFTFDNKHFFVDLVFYNRLLRCYVLIDLKRGEMTHQDLGQMQMYVNYFDRYVKTEDELPTVGIVLCGSKNDAVVELTLPEDANIYASKYQLYLPSKRELTAQLQSIQRELSYREGEDDK